MTEDTSSIEEPEWVTNPDCPVCGGKGWIFRPDDCEATDYLADQIQCVYCLEEAWASGDMSALQEGE